MLQSIRFGGAFIGLMVGVGFASGQEVLQFFTSFGYLGFAGGLAATAFFAFLVMNLYQIGCRLKTESHREAIFHICGPYFGRVVDWMLTFFLFGGIVVMLAGAGSSFEQQLSTSPYLGGAIVAIIAMMTVFLGLSRVITLMSLITPVLMLVVGAIAVHALTTASLPWSELEEIAQGQQKAASHWLVSSLLYVSYNVAGTAAVLVVIGSSIKDMRQATFGGIWGGVGIGILIIAMNAAMLGKVNMVAGVAIPTLKLSNDLAPWFGNLVLGLLLIKLYCTTSGLMYTLAARLKSAGVPFVLAVPAIAALGYAGSLFGFVKLVGFVYPLMGYLGFALMASIVFAWWRNRRVGASSMMAP